MLLFDGKTEVDLEFCPFITKGRGTRLQPFIIYFTAYAVPEQWKKRLINAENADIQLKYKKLFKMFSHKSQKRASLLNEARNLLIYLII